MSGVANWIWNTAKYYAQTSWYLAFLYGRVRGFVQPWVSTDFNISHIEEGVYLGDIACAYNREKLKELGITHIVTAVLGVEARFPDDFKYFIVPVRDIHSEDIRSWLHDTTDFINEALADGGKVLVHCVCGVSRSVTIVAAWHMARHGQSVDETIRLIQSKRDCANPIPSFRDQLEAL